MKTLGIIGFGNMADAIVNGLITTKAIAGQNIYVYNRSSEKLEIAKRKYGLTICQNEIDVINKSDIILFAVKPDAIQEIILKTADALENKSIISVIAGYLFDDYSVILPKTTRHLSLMPNTPLSVASGITLFEVKHSLQSDEYNFVFNLFQAIGIVEVVDSKIFTAATSISGCGPAFMYLVIEAIADGAVMEGLPRELAYRLASQTMVGAGMMQQVTQLHPGVLKDQVCSPGGTTIKGLKELEDGKTRAAFINAVRAAK